MILKNSRAPLSCYFRLCASFGSHWSFETKVRVRKFPICVKINDFLGVWPWHLTDDREKQWAPLLSKIKLCASCHRHMWIQTGVALQKLRNWYLTYVTLTFDLWPRPFAWTSLLSLVITPEKCMMIRSWERNEKGVRDGQTVGRTDKQTDRRKTPPV